MLKPWTHFHILLTIPTPTDLHIIVYIYISLEKTVIKGFLHAYDTPNDIYTFLHLCLTHMNPVLSNIIDGSSFYYHYSGALLLIHYICPYRLSIGFTLLITSLLAHDTLAHEGRLSYIQDTTGILNVSTPSRDFFISLLHFSLYLTLSRSDHHSFIFYFYLWSSFNYSLRPFYFTLLSLPCMPVSPYSKCWFFIFPCFPLFPLILLFVTIFPNLINFTNLLISVSISMSSILYPGSFTFLVAVPSCHTRCNALFIPFLFFSLLFSYKHHLN